MSKLTKEQKIAIIGNMHPPVNLTGEESLKEIDAIIRSRNNVEPAETATDPNIPVPKAKAKAAVHFTLTDGSKRSFTPADHGKGFSDVADEFHETNKIRIAKRLNE